MKIINILAFILLLTAPFSSRAQPVFKQYPDSIRVEMPDANGLVVFEMRNYNESSDYIRNFAKTLREALDHVRTGMAEKLADSPPLHIDVRVMPEGTREVGISTRPYGEKQLVSIRPVSPPKTTMTILKDRGVVELLPPGWEVAFESREYRVSVYASSLAALEGIPTQDFGIVADAVSGDEGMKTLGRKNIESQIVLRNGKVDQRAVNYVFPGDNIGLGLTAGVGLVQNIIYPELSLKLSLTFKDRFRRPNYRVSFVPSLLFFSESVAQGFTYHTNTFISVIYERNFNRKSAQPNWSGIGIGFLSRSRGDYFQGNTAKLFITHSIPNSRFSMVPEFYLTDDFKKFTFGMTLKYTF